MEKFYIIILSVLFSALVGMIGYWLKTAHREIKSLIKELVESLNNLHRLVTGIETQIEKGIEADISEIKTDIKELYKRTNTNESDIATLKEKTAK